MRVKIPIRDLGSVVLEMKKSYWARNVTYKGRVLWKSVTVQRDLGDVILQATYSVSRERLYYLTLEDFDSIQRLAPVKDLRFGFTVISRDFQRQTGFFDSIEEALTAPFFMDAAIDLISLPVVKKLSREKAGLACDINNDWFFIQHASQPSGNSEAA